MNRHKYLFCIVLLLISSKCQIPNIEETNVTVINQITNTSSKSSLESAIIYTTFNDIIENSDVIIIGQSISQKEVINSARDPDDLSIQDSSYFGVGQVYEVAVTNYLKGDGPKLINIIQNEGFILSNPKDVSKEDIERAKSLSDSLPLKLDTKYLMFLSFSELSYDGYTKGELLIGRGHPWRFVISSSSCVIPEDSISEVYVNFPTTPLNKVIRIVNDPNLLFSMTYPESSDNSECITGTGYPYP